MNAAFAKWSDFMLMGGYGFYVWLALGVSMLTLLLLMIQSIGQRKSCYRSIRQRQKRAMRRAQAISSVTQPQKKVKESR